MYQPDFSFLVNFSENFAETSPTFQLIIPDLDPNNQDVEMLIDIRVN